MDNKKEVNFISAVVYVHNQEELIQHFMKMLIDVLSNAFEKYEIICVNDASTDSSVEVLQKIAKEYADQQTGQVCTIQVVHMSYYHGLEHSMKAGIDLAIGDFVYEFDDININYEKEHIFAIYEQALCGYDIVTAVPHKKKKVSSTMFYNVFNAHANSEYPLQTETVRIISRRGINRVESMGKNLPYRKALYASCGLKLFQYSYEAILSNNKYKKDTKRIERIELAIDSLILFTNLAYKISLMITLFFLLSSITVSVYTVMVFLSGTPIEGWTTMMLFMSCSFLGIFAVFAIIIKYLSILTELVFKQKEYLIQSVEKY